MSIRRLASVFAFTAAFAACGGSDSPSSDTASADAGFKVALLTPGPISDQSWNGGAYAGLQRIRDSLGAQISHIQTKTPAEFDENFRQYGAQGYTLVFGHGFEYQDAAVRIAPQFPKTMFVTTSGTTVGPNVAGMNFAFEEASYLAGMLAGAVTKSGVIGCIGGTELPPVKTSFAAFEAGARRVRPDIRVVVSYLGNWDDVGAGKEQALAQIGRGVDVIFQNADAAGLGVFQAARETKKAWIVGSNADQNGIAPDVTLGSVVIDIPQALLLVAREVKAGTFTPRVVPMGLPSGVVTLKINDTVSGSIPASVRTSVDSLRAEMAAGRFTVAGASPALDTPR